MLVATVIGCSRRCRRCCPLPYRKGALSATGLLQIAISVILSVASGCCLIVP